MFREKAGQMALCNGLKAYSVLDEEVGYCQGMSFVFGLFLMQVCDLLSAAEIAITSSILRLFTDFFFFWGLILTNASGGRGGSF